MDSPSSRSLQILGLLQNGRSWTTQGLAQHLDVAPRTIRRDITRLRNLGYEIRSTRGPGSAYRLAPSAKIPPLLFEAQEVCYLVTGLLILEAGSSEAAVSTARIKLEKLLPPRLRRQAVATAMATQVLTPATQAVDWPVLDLLSRAVMSGHHVSFTYTDQNGRSTERHVQPHRHVLRKGVWYLIAFDTRRDDWRLFRIDRIRGAALHHPPPGYPPHPFPQESISEWLTTDLGRAKVADT